MTWLTHVRERVFARGFDVLPLPPPFRRMVAINSDVEWTTWPLQHHLIDTFAGLGLEASFSCWFFASPAPTWRLFEEDATPSRHFTAGTELIRRGVVDSLHSYGGRLHCGGCEFDRTAIATAFERLSDAGARLHVYSNHGSESDRQNVGGDWARYQEGDVPDSPHYHLDLATGHGLRYFWTDVDYDVDAETLRAGSGGKDHLLRVQTCRDGRRIVRFRRYLGRLDQGSCASNLGEQIRQVLAARDDGYSVLYTHLGVHRNPQGRPFTASEPVFPPDGREALEELAARQGRGEVLVTTTRRLLDHAALLAARPWRVRRTGQAYHVTFDDVLTLEGCRIPLCEESLAGWAVRVPRAATVHATLGGRPVPLAHTEAADGAVFQVAWPVIDMAAAAAAMKSN